jgi:hypothetical protein
LVRDLQVAVGPRATVLAWGEVRRRSQAVVVATADAGGRLTVRERVTVATATSAFPRLALLRSGDVVLAWRDRRSGARTGSRVRVATIGRDGFTRKPRTVGVDAAQIVLAARGDGAAVGWVSPHRSAPRKTKASVRRALPHTLTVRTLDARGLPSGTATIVGRDVGASARLAGSPDGRLVASWLRPQKILPFAGEARGDAPPPSAILNPVAFTRQVLPQLRGARPLSGQDVIPGSVPTVAFDAPGHAVAAWRASAAGGSPAFDALTADSSAGGPWSIGRLVAHLGFSRLDPVVAAPASGPVVVYSALLAVVGPPRWTVTAADAGGTHALGITTGGDGRGVAVARAADRVLVAWPSATGGVQVAEQG